MRIKIIVASFLIVSIVAMFAVPALGMGILPGRKDAKARALSYEIKYPYSLTKYLSLDVRGEQISPIPNIIPSPAPDPTDPQYPQYLSILNSAYVKNAGDDILVPTATSPAEVPNDPWTNANWGDMTPLTGFTDAKLKSLLYPSPFGYGDRYAAMEGEVPTVATVAELAYGQALLGAAGVFEYLSTIPYVTSFPGNMPKPADYVNEELPPVDRTYLVEFTVPASLVQEGLKPFVKDFLNTRMNIPDTVIGAYNPYLLVTEPESTYKIRGWFIKGDGIKKDSGEVVHPLVIISEGYGCSIFFGPPFSPNIGIRRFAHYLNANGLDVILCDSGGTELSTGWNRFHDWSPADGTGNAVNVFHMIDQLAGGAINILGTNYWMKSVDPDGNEVGGETPSVPLIDDAVTTPVILFGHSHGALISARAMQLYVDDIGGRKSKYNLRGVAQSGGLCSIKFVDDYHLIPPFAYMALEASLRWTPLPFPALQTTFYPDSEIFESIDKWPGYLAIKGIYDGFTPDEAVEAYNRARGFKEIAMLRGWHSFEKADPNFWYVAKKLVKFCKQVALNNPDMNNYATTTLWAEINKAPSLDLQQAWNFYQSKGWGPPAEDMGVLHGARTSYQNALKHFIENN